MLKGIFGLLVVLAAFSGLIGCATIEPQTSRNMDSSPKVKEEDITNNRATSQGYQVPQNPGALDNSGSGQTMNPLSSPSTTDTGSGRSPRRFIWKDKN